MNRFIEDVKLSEIEVDSDFNCRGEDITPSEVYDLMESIKNLGLIQPVLIRPSRKPKYKYSLFAGFRRYTACKFLKLETIKAILHTDITDSDAEIMNLIENTERKNLNMVQEANGVNKLYYRGWDVADIAKAVKQSKDWVSVRISLLQLPKNIQKEAAAGILTQKAIKEILPIYARDPDRAYKIVAQIRDKKLNHDKKSADKHVKKDKEIVVRTNRPMSEAFNMQDILLSTFGNNLASRAIAWQISEISTFEFLEQIKIAAEAQEMVFVIPQQYYDPKYKKDKARNVD